MREMAFLSQDYIMYQPHHHNNHHHDFNEEDHHHHHHHHEDPSISLNILSSCPPQEFQGGAGVASLAMMNRSFSGYHLHPLDHHQDDVVGGHDEEHEHDHHGGGGGGGGDQDDLSDDGSQVVVVGPGGGEKKKRLSMEQVKTLEKNFEQGNKLEPERKMQLAKALGLQPRQVAIWFQNRRARWKTKQLEKDYSLLKRQFDALKADNHSLLSQNKKLHSELISLRNREGTEYGAINLNNADTKSYFSNNGSEISSDMNLNSASRAVTPRAGSPLLSSNKLQFPPNSFIPPTITQLLQPSSPKPELDLQCPKIDPQLLPQDHAFCTIYGGGSGGGAGGNGGGIENQPPAFWAWPEQQQNIN